MNSAIMAKRFVLEVEVLEDLHSGTGTGGSSVDSIQALDRHGNPVIRSTHVKGVLRASAEELHALKPETFTTADIEKLFGSALGPGQQKMIGRSKDISSYISNNSWNRRGNLTVGSLKFVKEGQTKQPKTLMWSSTSRKINNRAPKDDTLRTVEFIPAGTKFAAEIRLADPELMNLFEACVRRTDRLGSSRSRGAGLVKMILRPVAVEQNGFETPNPKLNKLKLRLLLCNLEPLCLPVTGFPGNIIRSESYIRGQSVAGALAAWALDSGTKADLIFDRRISIGNALPLPISPGDGLDFDQINSLEVVPIPLSLMTPKIPLSADMDYGCSWPHWAKVVPPYTILGDRDEKDAVYDSTESDSKPRRPGDREFLFRRTPQDTWVRFAPDVGYHLRNQTPAPIGRRGDDQSLFAEEEIAENTYFLADICFYDQSDSASFCRNFFPVLNGSELLRIGRGGRPVSVVKASWVESHKPTIPQGINSHSLVITMESDLIARSSTLSFFTGLDGSTLRELTGLNDLADVDLEKSYSESIQILGFNATSGLPRAPVLALRRGSVFQVNGRQVPFLRQSLEKAISEMKWLGERTWEGFGRFRIDFNPLQNQANFDRKPLAHHGSFSESFEESILRKSKKLADALTSVSPFPSKSQWQFLRNKALAARDLAALQGILEQLIQQSKETKAGRVWSHVLPEITKSLHDETVSRDLQSARLYLDSLVRWLIVRKFREKN